MSAGATHRDVKSKGVRLRVVEQGAGPPVLFLHDLLMDHRTWDGVAGRLAAEFRVILPDFPGHGESERPPPARFAFDVPAFADTIADLFAGLGLGRAAVVGHGLGGAVAIALSASHRELVSRVVLVDALCFDATERLRVRLGLWPGVGGVVLKQLWGRASFRAFFRDWVLAPGSTVPVDRIDAFYGTFNEPAARGSAWHTLRGTGDTRAVDALTTRLTLPVLVVWGRHDRIVPARLGRRLAREIRGAGFELVDAGHAPQEERPEELAQVIGTFLRAERSGSR